MSACKECSQPSTSRSRCSTDCVARCALPKPAEPLVRNLENPGYLKILLNGQATLEERFAQIDAETVREELWAVQGSLEKVPPKIRQLIALPTFPADGP